MKIKALPIVHLHLGQRPLHSYRHGPSSTESLLCELPHFLYFWWPKSGCIIRARNDSPCIFLDISPADDWVLWECPLVLY